MSDHFRFPFAFAGVQRWMFQYVADGIMSRDDGWTLATLSHLMKAPNLAEGTEFGIDPERLLKHLERGSGAKSRDALRKKLDRMRQRGLLVSFRVDGNPHAGYTYFVTLPLAPPAVSALCPTSRGGSSPTSVAPKSATETDSGDEEREDASDLALPRMDESCPTSLDSCPTLEAAATPGTNGVRAGVPDELCPTYRDVRDDTNICSEEDVLGGASLSRTHAREDEEVPIWRRLATRAAIDEFPAGPERDFLIEFVETFDAVEVDP
jgi:hypothetical protein